MGHKAGENDCLFCLRGNVPELGGSESAFPELSSLCLGWILG